MVILGTFVTVVTVGTPVAFSYTIGIGSVFSKLGIILPNFVQIEPPAAE